MAIYRLSASIVKRSAGSSVVAAAAYRAAERLDDDRSGQTFDYTRRSGVRHSEIIVPEHAPAWMQDRGSLWSGVETAEKRKDAQLAREVQLALPHELTDQQRLELVREYVTEQFVARGMVADVAIHAPDREGDDRNHHAHVMLTLREIEGEGFGKKARAWNDTALLEDWREQWASHVNQALERAGSPERVDHRSYEAQGIDLEPQPKLGSSVTELERLGVVTDRGDERREVQVRNAERIALAQELANLEREQAALSRGLEIDSPHTTEAPSDTGQQKQPPPQESLLGEFFGVGIKALVGGHLIGIGLDPVIDEALDHVADLSPELAQDLADIRDVAEPVVVAGFMAKEVIGAKKRGEPASPSAAYLPPGKGRGLTAQEIEAQERERRRREIEEEFLRNLEQSRARERERER